MSFRLEFSAVMVLLLVLMFCGCTRHNTSTAEVDGTGSRSSVQFAADPNCYSVVLSLDYSDLMPSVISRSKLLREELGVIVPELQMENLNRRHPGMTDIEREVLLGIHYKSRFATFGELTDALSNSAVSSAPKYNRVLDPIRDPQSIARDFARLTDRDPHDGAELLLFSKNREYLAGEPVLNDESGLREFLSWEREKQLDYIMVFVNPFTGKVYQNFTDPSWKPGEIHMAASTEEDVKMLADIQYNRLKDAGEEIPAGWKFTTFGERTDSILSQNVNLKLPSGSRALNSSTMQDPNGITLSPFIEPATSQELENIAKENPCNPCTGNPCNPCNPCSH
ncbi:MAG: hypothetical protein R3F46_01795 [bacterium]